MTVPTSDNMETKSIWTILYRSDDKECDDEGCMMFFSTHESAVKYIVDNPALFLYHYTNTVLVEKYTEGIHGSVLDEWVTDGADVRQSIMDKHRAEAEARDKARAEERAQQILQMQVNRVLKSYPLPGGGTINISVSEDV